MGIFKKKKAGDDIDQLIDDADKEVTPLDESGRQWEEKPEQIESQQSATPFIQTNNSNVAPAVEISARVKADIDEVKSKVAVIRDLEKEYGERFERLTERIGNLSEENRENEKQLQELRSKTERVHDMVEDFDPKKLDVRLQKWESRLEQSETNFNSFDDKLNHTIDEFKEGTRKLNTFVGVEAFEKMKIEFEKDITTAKHLDAKIEKNSNKVENMFLEVEEKFQEQQKIKSEFDKVSNEVNGVRKEYDTIKVKVEKFIKKEDIGKFEGQVNNKFASLDKSILVIKDFLNDMKGSKVVDIKKQFPQMLKEFNGIKSRFDKLKTITAEVNSRLGKAVKDFVEVTDQEGITKLKETLQGEINSAIEAADKFNEAVSKSKVISSKQEELSSSMHNLLELVDELNEEVNKLRSEDSHLKQHFSKEISKVRKELSTDDNKILELLGKSAQIKQLEKWVRALDGDMKSLFSDSDSTRSFVDTEVRSLNKAFDKIKSSVKQVLDENDKVIKRVYELDPVKIQKQLSTWQSQLNKDIKDVKEVSENVENYVKDEINAFSHKFNRMKTEIEEVIEKDDKIESKVIKIIPKHLEKHVNDWKRELDREYSKSLRESDKLNQKLSNELFNLKDKVNSLNKDVKEVLSKDVKLSKKLDALKPNKIRNDFEKLQTDINLDMRTFQRSLDDVRSDMEKENGDLRTGFNDLRLSFERAQKAEVRTDRNIKDQIETKVSSMLSKWKNDMENSILDVNDSTSKMDSELSRLVKLSKNQDGKINTLMSKVKTLAPITIRDQVNRIQDSVNKKLIKYEDSSKSFENDLDRSMKRLHEHYEDMKKEFDHATIKAEETADRLKTYIPQNVQEALRIWKKEMEEKYNNFLTETTDNKKDVSVEMKNLNKEFDRMKREFSVVVKKDQELSRNLKSYIPDNIQKSMDKWKSDLVKDVKDVKRGMDKMSTKVNVILEKDEKIERRVREFAPLDLSRQIKTIFDALDEHELSLRDYEKQIVRIKKTTDEDTTKLKSAVRKIDDLSSLSSSFATADEMTKFVREVNDRIYSLNKYAQHVIKLSKDLESVKGEVLAKVANSQDKTLAEELRLLKDIKSELSGNYEYSNEMDDWMKEHLDKGYSSTQLKKVLVASNYDPEMVDDYIARKGI
jgi:chromosome segregation ATPase